MDRDKNNTHRVLIILSAVLIGYLFSCTESKPAKPNKLLHIKYNYDSTRQLLEVFGHLDSSVVDKPDSVPFLKLVLSHGKIIQGYLGDLQFTDGFTIVPYSLSAQIKAFEIMQSDRNLNMTSFLFFPNGQIEQFWDHDQQKVVEYDSNGRREMRSIVNQGNGRILMWDDFEDKYDTYALKNNQFVYK